MAPPPCATPRPLIVRSYVFFFDFGDASLTPRGRQILEELASHLSRNGIRFMELAGYTDAEEARTVRLSLSMERAQAAQAYLAGLGIPSERMVADGRGASQPLVPSDGREPQNRRVQPFPIFYDSEADREAGLQRLECRIWVRDHCFTPSRLAHAGAVACNAALTGAVQ